MIFLYLNLKVLKELNEFFEEEGEYNEFNENDNGKVRIKMEVDEKNEN